MNSTSITYTRVERRLLQTTKKFTTVKILLFFLLFIWFLGIVFPLVSPINNNHLLVSTRYTGLYFSALMFIILLMVKPFKVNRGLKPFFFFSAPLIVDAIAIRIGIYNYSAAFTFVTGFMIGAITIIYIINTIENSFLIQENKKYGL